MVGAVTHKTVSLAMNYLCPESVILNSVYILKSVELGIALPNSTATGQADVKKANLPLLYPYQFNPTVLLPALQAFIGGYGLRSPISFNTPP